MNALCLSIFCPGVFLSAGGFLYGEWEGGVGVVPRFVFCSRIVETRIFSNSRCIFFSQFYFSMNKKIVSRKKLLTRKLTHDTIDWFTRLLSGKVISGLRWWGWWRSQHYGAEGFKGLKHHSIMVLRGLRG